MPALSIISRSRWILPHPLKPEIAVALFLLIPGMVVKSPAGTENTASIEPNLSERPKNAALPIPAIDFKAIQYFSLACIIGNILIGNAKFKLLSTDLEL